MGPTRYIYVYGLLYVTGQKGESVPQGPTKEQLSRLRWLSIAALSALFVADYGFDLFRKPVPQQVYYVLGAIAIGIDIRQMRELIILFAKSWINNTTKSGSDKNERDK